MLEGEGFISMLKSALSDKISISAAATCNSASLLDCPEARPISSQRRLVVTGLRVETRLRKLWSMSVTERGKTASLQPLASRFGYAACAGGERRQ
jgi:hypothetical protein